MADPHFQIRGGGAGHQDPEMGGGRGDAVSKKKMFQPFGPHFGLKLRGGGGAGSATGFDCI